MDDELQRQLQQAKAAVQQARSRAIAHVQAAKSQMEYDVTSLQAMTLEHIADQKHSQNLQELWAAWVGYVAYRRRLQHMLGRALSHRAERNLRSYFKGWFTARGRLVKERTHNLRQQVVEHELQLRRVQGAAPSARPSSRLALQSDVAIESHTAALESELRSAQQETAAAELQSRRMQETVQNRKRDLGSIRTAKNEAERELATHRTELEESLSSISDATPMEYDPEITRLRELVEQQERQIAAAVRTRTYLENSKEEELERLEDEQNQQFRLRTSADLHHESVRKQLAKYEAELKEYRTELATVDDRGATVSTGTLLGDLQKAKSLREASESRLLDRERKVATMEQELVRANAAAEAAIQELHSSTVKLRACVDDQIVEQSGAAKTAELSMGATRRQMEAYEQDLLQARIAIKHAEEELVLHRDAHTLRIQSENSAAARANLNYDELRTKLHAIQNVLRDAKAKASAREQVAHEESEKLAAQLAEQDAAAERFSMHASDIARQIENQQAELAEINVEIEDTENQKHTERLAIDDSVGQQLVQESLGAQSLKLIHDSALRTFAAVEDRLKEAKLDAEKMHAKADAQRLQLSKLVREAQRARREADKEHQAAVLKHAKLQGEIDETRARVSSLEASLHVQQAELGDRRRKAASARSTDETKHVEESRTLAAQEAELARARKELSASQAEIHGIRDTHGGLVHEAAMKRRLAEQEVELLRQDLDKLINTTPKLRSQCLVAETECRKLQIQLSRMRTRPKLQAATEFIGLLNSNSPRPPSATSSAVNTGLQEYAQRRSPPRIPRKTASPEDEPVLMDIDTIIRQVAEEHARSVAYGYSPAAASRQSPPPKFSPPRSPAVAMVSPQRVPRQPNLFSPSPGQQEDIEEAPAPNRHSPTRRCDFSTAVAPRARDSGQQPIAVSSRMNPERNRDAIAPRKPSSAASSKSFAIEPREPPEWSRQLEHCSVETRSPASSSSKPRAIKPRKSPRVGIDLGHGAVALSSTRAAVPPRQPGTSRASGVRPIPPRARVSGQKPIAVSSRMNPESNRAAIAPREPSSASSSRPCAIEPREPPEWSRQLEHSSVETGTGLLQPPRLEIDLDHRDAT